MLPLTLIALVLALAPMAHAADGPKAASPTGAGTAWLAAMKANDVDAIAACYDEKATLWMPEGARLDGRAAIRASFAEWLGAMTVVDAVLKNVSTETSGTLSSSWGEYALTMKPKAGGDPITMTGRFTDVSVKRNGRWVYIADHASPDPAMTAEAPMRAEKAEEK
jgi:uncharacterized protein (TIGR02246 family)